VGCRTGTEALPCFLEGCGVDCLLSLEDPLVRSLLLLRPGGAFTECGLRGWGAKDWRLLPLLLALALLGAEERGGGGVGWEVLADCAAEDPRWSEGGGWLESRAVLEPRVLGGAEGRWDWDRARG